MHIIAKPAFAEAAKNILHMPLQLWIPTKHLSQERLKILMR